MVWTTCLDLTPNLLALSGPGYRIITCTQSEDKRQPSYTRVYLKHTDQAKQTSLQNYPAFYEESVGFTLVIGTSAKLQADTCFCSKSTLEEDIEALKKLEEEVVVSAIWKYANPRLSQIQDRNAFITLVQDLFPNGDVDFGDDAEDDDAVDQWGAEINTEVTFNMENGIGNSNNSL